MKINSDFYSINTTFLYLLLFFLSRVFSVRQEFMPVVGETRPPTVLLCGALLGWENTQLLPYHHRQYAFAQICSSLYLRQEVESF